MMLILKLIQGDLTNENVKKNINIYLHDFLLIAF